MDRLRECFEELGFENVTTFIASGNVIFSASARDVVALERKIERHLARSLGYDVATFIRSPAELKATAAFEPSEPVAPFEPSGPGQGAESASSLYVVFLAAPADDDLRSRFVASESEMDHFSFSGREIYWHIQGKLTDSPLFGAGLQKVTGDVPTTMRNMTTVRRLVAKLGA